MTNQYREFILKYLNSVLQQVLEKYTIDIEKEAEQWRINISSEKTLDIFENYEGEFLRSLQHIVRVLVHKEYPTDRTHFVLDFNGKRKARSHAISVSIPEIAQNEVLTNGNTVILVGLSGYERLQVHRTLSEIKGLNTSSVGPQDNRKLLIMPTSEIGSSGMDKAKIVDIEQLLKTLS
jgi:predicted RNA-binding protein Jag